MESSKALGERIWQDIVLCVPIEIFSEMARQKITFAELNSKIEKYRDFRNDLFGLGNLAHDRVCFTKDNERFVFGFFDKEFCVWDKNGAHSIGTVRIDLDSVPSQEFIDWLGRITNDYILGNYHCSDCGKLIEGQKDCGGKYFAGVYCKNCWNNNGWRIKAANETYD